MAFVSVVGVCLLAGAVADSLTAMNVQAHRSTKESEDASSGNRVMRSERVINFNGEADALEDLATPAVNALFAEKSHSTQSVGQAPPPPFLNNPGFDFAPSQVTSTFQSNHYLTVLPPYWTASSNAVVVMSGASWGSGATTPDSSVQYLGLQGAGTAYVSQAVSTTPLTPYTVTFQAAYPSNAATSTAVCVLASPSNITSAAQFSLTSSWAMKTFTFFASSATTTLKFSNCGAGPNALIDNIYLGLSSLLGNPGFENGAVKGSNANTCPSPWKCYGDGEFLVVKGTSGSGADGTTVWGRAQPPDGVSYIVLATENTYIEQAFATNVGSVYNVSLSVASYVTSVPGSVICLYNDSGITNIMTQTLTSNNFGSYFVTFNASGTSTTIHIANCNPTGAVLVDSVQVLQANVDYSNALQAPFVTTETTTSTANYPWTMWNPWGPCDVTCGYGTQSRNKTNGDGHAQLYDTRNCNVTGCPQDCSLGDWTIWDDCDAPSGSCLQGNSTRTRNMIPAMYGGLDCEGEIWLVEAECCVTDACATPCANAGLDVPEGTVMFTNYVSLAGVSANFANSHDNAVAVKSALVTFLGCPGNITTITLYQVNSTTCRVEIVIVSSSYPNITTYANNFATLMQDFTKCTNPNNKCTPKLWSGINQALAGQTVTGLHSTGHKVVQGKVKPVATHAFGEGAAEEAAAEAAVKVEGDKATVKIVDVHNDKVLHVDGAELATPQAATVNASQAVHEPMVGEKFATMSDGGPDVLNPSPIRSLALKREVLLAAVITLFTFV